MTKVRDDRQIGYLREELADKMIDALRLRRFGVEWDPSNRCFLQHGPKEAEGGAGYAVKECERKAEYILTLMSLPSAPIAESLAEQAKQYDAEVAYLELRAEKLRKMSIGLKAVAKIK